MHRFSQQITCFWWQSSAKMRRHPCVVVQIMLRISSQHPAGTFSLQAFPYHILSEDFPANDSKRLISPQLIALLLQSPIMAFIPSASPVCFPHFTPVLPHSGASINRWIWNVFSLLNWMHMKAERLSFKTRSWVVQNSIPMKVSEKRICFQVKTQNNWFMPNCFVSLLKWEIQEQNL